jgi:quinol-cytochrome oxidoreductase complex cytochrome b subunit
VILTSFQHFYYIDLLLRSKVTMKNPRMIFVILGFLFINCLKYQAVAGSRTNGRVTMKVAPSPGLDLAVM